jgi:hypothetical protein
MKKWAVISLDDKAAIVCGIRPEKVMSHFFLEAQTEADAVLKVEASKAYHERRIPFMFGIVEIPDSMFSKHVRRNEKAKAKA